MAFTMVVLQKETLINTIQNEEKMLMEVDVEGSMKIKELYPKKHFQYSLCHQV